MKKILLTNNSQIINDSNNEHDIIYTDSPYIIKKYSNAIYLDTLLDKNFQKTISNIRKKGYDINRQIINIFFSKYENRNINILNIKGDFTNIFINVVKLYKIIELYPNDEITIGISNDELYNSNSPDILEGITNRFSNIYYWIADLVKINVKLTCNNSKSNFNIGHSTIDSWFLRLVDIDKKVLFFNFLKKIKLININKKDKIYVYKKSPIIREIEPYLHDKGFSLVNMPELTFNFINEDDLNKYKDLRDILDSFFENDPINSTFKTAIFEMFKKRIKYYSKKEIYTEKYISKLDKSIKFILTNTINGFDSHIFAKQLQLNGYKIINTMHGLSTSFLDKSNFDFYECEAPDITLCFNTSERDMYKELVPNARIYPISIVQEAKKKRFNFLKRFFVNRILKTNNKINIFYPSIIYPHNNVGIYGFKHSDKWSYDFEKKMIESLSGVNKQVIYKDYPMKGYTDTDPLIKYADSFDNIKVIKENYDFRFVSSIGDIFILGSIGFSSTITWMLGENKPIIYLHTNKFRKLNEKAINILNKTLIVINIDDDDWIFNLTNLLNKPFDELVKIWKDKQVYRDQYDEEWLMGTNLHAGKLGSNYIKKYIIENK